MSMHEEPDADTRPGSLGQRTAPSSAAELSQTIDGRTGRIRARGVLDRDTAERIISTVVALVGAGHERISLDLRQMDATESTALRELHDLQEGLRARGRRLTVVHPLAPAAP